MRNFSILFLLVLLYFYSGTKLRAQPQPQPNNFHWKWAVNNTMKGASFTQVVIDPAGNVYTAGFNLTKHDPTGALIWSRNLIDSSQAIFTRGLSKDAAGNLYLSGYFSGIINLDTFNLTSYGHTDIFIAKFNANGNVQWARRAGSPGPPPLPMPPIVTEAAYGIAADSAGNCYITGVCSPGANFGTIVASLTTNNFVAKYDSQGNVQWVRAIPREALGITIGPLGSYAVTGGAGTGTIPVGVYVNKYNANGSLDWSKQGTGYSYGTSITADQFGNFYMTGYANDTTTIDNFTILPPSNNTGSSMFLIKYNAFGVQQWGKQTSGNSCDGANVVTDLHGNAYVTGGMVGNVNFDTNLQLTGINNGWQDIFVIKYNAAGGADWGLRAGSSGSDQGQGIAVMPNGDIYVTGSYQTNCTFGNTNLIGGNANNFFVAKIIANPLGTAKSKSEDKFRLYPNPANSIVKIIAATFKEGKIIVYNYTGQQFYEAPISLGHEFFVGNWPAGVYFLKVVSKEQAIIKKLVVTN